VKGGAAGVGTSTTSSVVTCNHYSDRFDTLYNVVYTTFFRRSHPLQMVELRDVHMRFEKRKCSTVFR